MRINDSSILYFSSFAGKNSFIYSLSVKNILKSDIVDCKYYYIFSDFQFSHDYLTKNISFIFDMLFNNNRVISNCLLYEKSNLNDNKNIFLSCYFDLEDEICESNNLSYYDLKIENVEDNIEIKDFSQKMVFKGFNNKETITIISGNIKDKYIENNKLIFILENN